MAVQAHRDLMTVEEYLAFDRAAEFKHEYIDGHAYAMAGGTKVHGQLGARAIRILDSALESGSCRVYSPDVRVRISEGRYVYPDASVSCDRRDQGPGDVLEYPRVVVEVLSDSTEAYDRGEKFGHYRGCSTLQEYVLVSQRRPVVEVYRRSGEEWVLREFGPDDQVILDSLGVRFPVAELYRNVDLAAAAGGDSGG